jgi:lipopolysaccharide/colanic/teichoic acid biosynthesis glycosyltransferase
MHLHHHDLPDVLLVTSDTFRVGRIRRMLDVLVAVALLLVTLPVLLLAMLLVRTDGGPAFYRQVRIGEGGRSFRLLKLRSMSARGGGPAVTAAGDARITRVGRILRRTSIDELPQLWHVLRGEMTLVGPRPERPEIVTELERRFPHYTRRHLVKPGITGWAQLRCGYAGSELGTAWKLCHDLFYVKRRSVLADWLIIVETLFEAGRDAHRALRAPEKRFLVGETSD